MRVVAMNRKPGFPMKYFLLALFLSVVLIGCSEESKPSKQITADIRAGKTIVDKDCKACHGLNGKGVAPGIPNLAGQRERYILAALTEYKEGTRIHAALRSIATNMTDADRRNVAGYYSSLPPIPAAKTPIFSPYDNGKTVAAACARCHSENGNSTTAGTPNLAGQQPRYFYDATQEYMAGLRQAAPMNAMLHRLSRLNIESVALYYASQTPAPRSAPATGDPAKGEPLTAVCGGCHGEGGVSTDAATPSLASQDPQYLAAAIKAYRTTRRKNDTMSRMVANLTDAEINDIVAYYAMQKGKPAEDGQALVKDIIAKCNRCHANDIYNPALAIPSINGQDQDYLILALRAYRDGKRENSLMHNMSVPYSDAIIESLASYYANQSPK
jgi:cytochrome c553